MIDKVAFWALMFMSIVDDVHLEGSPESQLRIGKAFNLVTRYGYLSLSMRVIPFNENMEDEKWVFKEPTHNVYKNLSDITESTEENEPGVFNGDFHMEFCDNRRQLYQAYFRDFTIDCLDKPWEAFTGSWYPDHAAKKLGIGSTYLQGNYSYVLVRVVRVREVGRLKVDIPLNQTFDSAVRSRMNLVVDGNSSTVMKFTQTIGTHYISSYKTGNSLYQVFAYTRKNYIAMKERIKAKGIQNLMRQELYTFFLPTYAAHVGRVRSISANATIEEWAYNNLKEEYFPQNYTMLMKLYGNRTLLATLDHLLGNDAILQIDLRSLNVIFQEEPRKESWFHEILDNLMKLLEVNLPQY